MRALVDDILDVAKMETGNLTVEKAPVDLPAMLRDVSRMWEDQARAKGLTFDLDVSAAPSRIESDPARLRQVVFNLLSNALKFTQAGSIHVSSGVIPGADGEQVAIVIRDTGIGIPRREARPDLRIVPPGRRRHHAPVRRHRAGARDLPQHRARDGRRRDGGQRGRAGIDLHLRGAAGARRRRSAGRRRTAAPRRC